MIKPLFYNSLSSESTHIGVFEDLRVLVKRWWVDCDPVSLSDEELLSSSGLEVGVMCDVANHEDTARQARRLLHETVCKHSTPGLYCTRRLAAWRWRSG